MSNEWTSLPSHAALRARGAAVRKSIPRRLLAELPLGDRGPLAILDAQNATRQQDLLPLRRERMAASPFTFYRGTAALMAADLAGAPHSGILVASCGDAHVSNFGFYASAQRDLMFDLNDFDEAAWAPWEWDVKRLVTSIVIGGRATDRADAVIDQAARAAVTTYTRLIGRATEYSPKDRYYAHFDVESTSSLLDKASRKDVRRSAHQAQGRTGERAVRKLTEVDADGRRRFITEEPATTPLTDQLGADVHALVDQYRATATPDVALLFDHYGVSDVARRVVGVGSVGTRCYLVLFQDGDDNTLLMQPKQATQSVLVEHGRVAQPDALQRVIDEGGEGARVVAMQRILQALSDPFLGDLRTEDADYYVRQFHDMKGSIEVEELDDGPFVTYAKACAAVVARAHSQSVTSSEVAGYIGRGRAVGEAILKWAHTYAELSLADYNSFRAAG